jgi:glycosyltransferase involved in cell wall biosynthesis
MWFFSHAASGEPGRRVFTPEVPTMNPAPNPNPNPNPTVSVLLPAYNAGRYVAQAVESILRQTFADFELLILDDGSADDTGDVCRRYTRDTRVAYLRRGNRGLVATLNELAGLARGGLLARMDADDVARPGRLAAQVAYLRAHPDCVLVGGMVRSIDEWGGEVPGWSPPCDDAAIQDCLLRGMTAVYHPTAMMRRDAFDVAGGYRPEAWPAEDLDLWLRLGELGRLANLPDVVLEYRDHGGSIMSNHMARGLAAGERVAREAAGRRGVESPYEPLPAYRPTTRGGLAAQAIERGWGAWHRGDGEIARRYAARALRLAPWRPAAWRLLRAAVRAERGPATA